MDDGTIEQSAWQRLARLARISGRKARAWPISDYRRRKLRKQAAELGLEESERIEAAIERWARLGAEEAATGSLPLDAEGKLDELAAANAIIGSWEGKVRFSAAEERYYWLRGCVWERERPGATLEAITLALRAFGEAEGTADALRKGGSSAARNAVERLIRVDKRIALSLESQWDQRTYLLGLPGGKVLDLSSGQYLKPDSKADIERSDVTLTAGVSPHKITPEYLAGGGSIAVEDNPLPPLFSEFLEGVMADPEDIGAWLKKYLGYLLTGKTEAQTLLYIYGPGKSGKTTFLDILKHILGDYAWRMDADILVEKPYGHPAGIAALDRKRLCYVSEMPEGTWRRGLIKSITGGGEEKQTARQLYGDWYEFIPRCKLLIVANDIPSMGRHDPALADRLALIEFPNRFEGPAIDRKLPSRLKAEAGKILDHLIAQAYAILPNPGQLWDKRPEGLLREASEYSESENDLLTWAREWLDELQPPEGGWRYRGPSVKLTDLRRHYNGKYRDRIKPLSFRKGLASVINKLAWPACRIETGEGRQWRLYGVALRDYERGGVVDSGPESEAATSGSALEGSL